MGNSKVRWVQLGDGQYDGVTVRGDMLAIGSWDELGQKEEVGMFLPDNIRLCQSVPDEGGVPVEAIQTIVFALEAWWTYGADAGMPSQTEIRDVEIVRSWLATQTKGGE